MRESREIRQKQQRQQQKQQWQQVKNTYEMATKKVMLFLRFYAYVACCCCYYICVVVGYGKGVLETGFQLCQTMMLCTSVCVCVCASPFARPLTHSLSTALQFFFSSSSVIACTGCCCRTHTFTHSQIFAVGFQWQRTFLYNGK